MWPNLLCGGYGRRCCTCGRTWRRAGWCRVGYAVGHAVGANGGRWHCWGDGRVPHLLHNLLRLIWPHNNARGCRHTDRPHQASVRLLWRAGGHRRWRVWHSSNGGPALLTRRPHPQDLVLTLLSLDQQVTGLTRRNSLASLKALKRGKGNCYLGAGLTGPGTVWPDDQILFSWHTSRSLSMLNCCLRKSRYLCTRVVYSSHAKIIYKSIVHMHFN